MGLFDELDKQLPPPVQGAQPSIRPDYMDPSDVENSLQPPHDTLPQPDPMKVMVADASGKVPLPTRAPDRSVQNFEQPAPVDEPPAGTYKVPDRVQSDPSHIVVADVVLGGTLPWLQAAADVATGAIPKEKFEEARMQHAQQLEELRAQHPELISAAEKAMPFLSGIGIGMLRPAGTILGSAGRGAAAGAAQGYVKGYTSGPKEEPTVSSNRMAQGMGSAMVGAAEGAAGGAAGHGAVAMLERKAASKVAGGASVSDDASRVAKREARTKQAAEQERIQAEADRGKDESLAKQFKTYREPPAKASQYAEGNASHLTRNPIDAFKQQAARTPTLDAFSRNTGLSPAAILAKLHGKQLPVDTPGQQALYKELQKVNESWASFQKTGNPKAGLMDRPKNTPEPSGYAGTKQRSITPAKPLKRTSAQEAGEGLGQQKRKPMKLPARK